MPDYEYRTKGVCSTWIRFRIEDGILVRVQFDDGCDGNLKAIGRLAEGLPVADVIHRLKGIGCETRKTSCPDQLARALEETLQTVERRN